MDAVLHGARHMVAMQIASDPTVRQVLRRAFRERAILSVRPTKKGKKVLEHFVLLVVYTVYSQIIIECEIFLCVSFQRLYKLCLLG